MKQRILSMIALGLAATATLPAQDKEKKPAPPKPAAAPRVELDTSLGKIVLELDPAKAPVTVENFLGYVKDGYYDGTIFHRVIGTFMIQGGGFELKNGVGTQKKTKDPIKNEGKNGLRNARGTIAMARTGDPNSATAQFFINVMDNLSLDFPRPDGHGYAVFGKVVEGIEVVDKIKAVKTGQKALVSLHPNGKHLPPRSSKDVPLEPVVIKKAQILPAAKKDAE